MTRTITNPGFSPKAPAEIIVLGFDFAALTSAPSSPVVTISRQSGSADPAPGDMLSGIPVVTGTKVLQKVIGGVAGTRYVVQAQVDAPDGSRYLLAGVLPVAAP